MASTSVTTVGGVVIVTQVIPKDDFSIPLETPADPAVQAAQPVVKTPLGPSKEDAKESVFLRGEPLGLGVRVRRCRDARRRMNSKDNN